MDTRVILYGEQTPSDLFYDFDQDPTNQAALPSPEPSTHFEIASEAESAPPDVSQLFDTLCAEYAKCVDAAGKVLPPEWTMPDLVRSMLGDQASQHAFLTETYYDLMLCGTRSWGCEELLNLLDLINYV